MTSLQAPFLASSPRRSPRGSPAMPPKVGPYMSSPLSSRLPPIGDSYAEVMAQGQERVLSTNMQTAFNIVNNYVGIVLLSMSFCCAQAGWFSIIALFVLTLFGAYTGSLIVRSYIMIEGEGETVPSYAQIGQRCLGGFGKWLVLGSSILETYVAILCMNIIIWNNAALLLAPNVPLHWVQLSTTGPVCVRALTAAPTFDLLQLTCLPTRRRLICACPVD